MDELKTRKCIPCHSQMPRLANDRAQELLKQAPEWRLFDNKLWRTFMLPTFPSAIQFVDRMAEIAEAEGHHPIITIRFNQVDVQIWTHAINGLHDNDFILAAKIGAIPR